MAGSFQIDEAGFDHQDRMPSVPGPEGLAWNLMVNRIAGQIPAPLREKLQCRHPIEVRPVNPMNLFAPEKREPVEIQLGQGHRQNAG